MQVPLSALISEAYSYYVYTKLIRPGPSGLLFYLPVWKEHRVRNWVPGNKKRNRATYNSNGGPKVEKVEAKVNIYYCPYLG